MQAKRYSIRNILLLTVGSLTVLIVLLILGEIDAQWRRLSRIESLKDASYLSDRLFDAEERLSEERGISYFLLNAPDRATISGLSAQNKVSRARVDDMLLTAFRMIRKYDFDETSDQLRNTEKQFSNLKELRARIDAAVAQPLSERDPLLSQLWFDKTTAMILETQNLRMRFMKYFADIDPIVTLHMRFKHLLGIISEYSGRERSIIGRLLVANANPTPQEQAQLLQWQGAVDLAWNVSETIADQGGLTPGMAKYFKDARSHYFTIFGMMRDIFYTPRTQHHGTSYPISVDFWLELATEASESLNTLKGDALRRAHDYMDVVEAKARREIDIYLLLLLITVVLCFVGFRTVSRRVIYPIHGIIGALVSATEGKPVPLAPLFQNRQDEIGQLAHVLDVFQKNAEQVRNAQKSNALLAAIVESSDDAILSKAPDETITSWNKGAERLFGYSAAEAIGRHIGLIIPPERILEEEYIAGQLSKGMFVEHLETVRRHKNGQDIDVSLTASPIRDAGGNIAGTSKIIRNITARKEAEREAQESQHRYRALVESSSQVVWIWKEGAVDERSPLWQWWEAITGQPAAEIATYGWVETVHPDDRERVQKIWTEAIANGTSYEMDYRLRARNGSYVHVEIKGVPVLGSDGRLREFVGTLNDVTERKKAEQEIIDGATRLKVLFNTVMDGLITINSRGIIQSFNAAAERIFGYKAAEVIGNNVKMLMPEPYHSEHDVYIGNYQRSGEAKIIGIGREVTAKRKDGSVFPMELGINEFSVGGEEAFVGMIRDITVRKEAEMKLLHYTDALEQSNRELDDFAYIASHDLKEPLRGLHNHARFLLEDNQDKLDPDSVSRLNRLTYLSQRMERLVNDLLYFSRLGRQELAIQAADLNEVIDDIQSTLDILLSERNARIVIPKTLPTVTCDKLRVTEAFRNLITNAVKYNDSPEKIIEVGFHDAFANGDDKALRSVFYVRDNGRGVEPGFYDEIFRIFKRLQSNKDSAEEGTGVGLTFVKKIIERHGGKIWLESEPGRGTTFYFTLRGK